MRHAIVAGFDWVDLETDVAEAIRRYKDVKRIVSYHNMREVPGDLEQIHTRMCQQDADMNARAGNRRQHLVQREHPRLRDIDGRVLERPLDQDVRHADTDERHHQRRDDLVRLVAGLQKRGDERPYRARRSREECERDQREPARLAPDQAGSEPRDEGRAEKELAVVAEVPDVRAEHDHEADRNQQERCGPHRAVLPGGQLDPALPDVRVERDRIAPERKEKDRAGPQGQEQGHDRSNHHVEHVDHEPP